MDTKQGVLEVNFWVEQSIFRRVAFLENSIPGHRLFKILDGFSNVCTGKLRFVLL